jgi:hypothetical protein
MLIILLLFFFWSCTSCNEDKPSQDADSIQDSDVTENEVVEDDTFSDPEPDEDKYDDDNDDSDIPDYSDNPYWEAYSDSEKNVAYHYYGDEPVKASDPENIRDLWSKKCVFDQCLECKPAPYDKCSDNYPFEPLMVNGTGEYHYKKTSEAGKFQCDALLSPGEWATSDLFNSVQLNENNGKVSYLLENSTTEWQGGGTFTYDIKTRKIQRIGRAHMDGWQNSKYYFVSTYDYRVDSDHEDSPYSGPKNRHFFYYDKEENKYGYALKFAEVPTEIVDVRASETCLFMSAHFKRDATDMRILYTKIGEWDKWKELTYQKDTLFGVQRRAGYPSMIDNFVVYFDYNIAVQFCDLEKGDAGCFKVSKDDEYGRYPLFKDKNTVIYTSQAKTGDKEFKLVMADITDKENIKYSTIYEWSELNSIQAGDLDDKYILMMRKYSNGGAEDVKDACLYRFEDGKTICMDEPFDLKFRKDHGYIYEHFYIFQSIEEIVVRDLECYCDIYPNKCPLIDYTPNPENPKDPWRWDWKPGE